MGKAPGDDRVETMMLRKLKDSPTFIRMLTNLYNGCLATGCFPRVWKHGIIKALLKAPHKDRIDPNSYRPVCLLPFLGKTLERLIKARLSSIILHPTLSSRHQYGFRKKRATEDAIMAVREMMDGTPEKYVVAILFDVTAALDNLAWASLLSELANRGCPRDLSSLIADYFRNRTVELCGTYTRVTKGCPQGSILGPQFWNMVFDGLLRALEDRGIRFAAYADDLVIVVSAETRLSLEQRADEACRLVTLWMTNHHLHLSTTKTEMVAHRGNLHRRPPIVRVHGTVIRLVRGAKYLGVFLTRGMNLAEHLTQKGDRCKSIFNLFAQAARAIWGLDFPMLAHYYLSIFLPVI